LKKIVVFNYLSGKCPSLPVDKSQPTRMQQTCCQQRNNVLNWLCHFASSAFI